MLSAFCQPEARLVSSNAVILLEIEGRLQLLEPGVCVVSTTTRQVSMRYASSSARDVAALSKRAKDEYWEKEKKAGAGEE
jgi:hypothetical protein